MWSSQISFLIKDTFHLKKKFQRLLLSMKIWHIIPTWPYPPLNHNGQTPSKKKLMEKVWIQIRSYLHAGADLLWGLNPGSPSNTLRTMVWLYSGCGDPGRSGQKVPSRLCQACTVIVDLLGSVRFINPLPIICHHLASSSSCYYVT